MSSGKPLLSGIHKGEAAGNSRSRRRPRLEVQAQRAIRKHQMIRPGECVLVAVSGGADSTALLLCLRRLAPTLGVTLAAAHLNHCIRGAEADADEDFVR